MSQEKLKKNGPVEITTLEVVQPGDRKNWIDVAMIQAGVFISVAAILVGGTLAASMTLGHAILAGFLGYAIACLFAVVTGIIGEDLHIPTCVVTKSSFGETGSRLLVSLAFSIACIGWFAVQNTICGDSFTGFMEGMGYHFPATLSTVIWGAIMLITAVIGIDSLKWLNRIAVPALVVIMLIGLFVSLKNVGTTNINAQTEETMCVFEGTMLVVSMMGVTMTCAPDFTRYQKTRGGVWSSTYIGIMPAAFGLLAMGAILASIVGETDLTVIMFNIGMPILGSIVLILSTWTTNTTNAWSAGINMVMFFNLKDDKRAFVTGIAGIFGTVLAVMGLMSNLENFFNWLGYLFMPIAGVMAADYWVIRKGTPDNWGYCKGFNWTGILSFFIGAVLAVMIPSAVSILVAFFVSAIAYIILYRLLPKKAECGLDSE